MRKLFAKIAILLGIVCCLLNPHPRAIAEKVEKAKTSEIESDGIFFTTGLFLSDVRHDMYVMRTTVDPPQNGQQNNNSADTTNQETINANKEIVKEVQGDFDRSLAGLAHVPLLTFPTYKGVRTGFALSAGVGIDGPNLTENLQVAAGISVFFKSQNHTLALSFGKIVRSVQRLNNYDLENPPSGDNVTLTRAVPKPGNFLSVTASFDLESLIEGFTSRNDSDTPENNGNGDEGTPNADKSPSDGEAADTND